MSSINEQLPTEMMDEIFRHFDHNLYVTSPVVCKQWNSHLSNIKFLCYECGTYHKALLMQDYDCVICGMRKCRTLHGGHIAHTCRDCETTNLCIKCWAQGLCCKNE